jgi:hypothetical protein
MGSTISFVSATRKGESFAGGGSKAERRFFDIVVDGISLWERLGKSHDMVSVLCIDFATPETLKAVDRLLLRADADLPNDRRSLFVCAECGDLGCGAITLRVTTGGNTVVWGEFGYENNYEEGAFLDDHKDVGTFEFDAKSYDAAFLDIAAILAKGADSSRQ